MKIPVAILSAAAVFGMTVSAAFAEVEAIDAEALSKVLDPAAKVEKVAGEMKFTEGPVWFGSGAEAKLIFSDIPANELKSWTQAGGLTVFREGSNNANGNTVDLEGRLVTAEHSGRRISLTEKDGSVKTVVDQYDGKKFNSPNDVVVKSDGTFWFTDPPYGLPRGSEGKEQEGNYVFRHDPKTGQTSIVSKDQEMPNGLAFSPDEKRLYIADSGKPRAIRVYEVKDDGTLSEGKAFCEIDKGGPDGIRVDAAGNVWSSSGDGAQIFSPDGTRIGRVLLPEGGANLCFGGPDGATLFITARTSLYSVPTKTRDGAKR